MATQVFPLEAALSNPLTIEYCRLLGVNPATEKENFQKLVLAACQLAEANVRPRKVVHITAIEHPMRPFLDEQGNRRQPNVSEATGYNAAYRLADGTHRLATEEEITRFKEEQKLRTEKLAEVEFNKPENQARYLSNQIASRLAAAEINLNPPGASGRPARGKGPEKE